MHSSRAALAVAVLTVFGVRCGQQAPAPTPAAPTPPAAIRTFSLPETVSFPEGVAFDAAQSALYTASAVDGTVVRVSVASGAAEVVAGPGVLVPEGSTTFPAVLGMKIDASQRLWIAGGRTGTMSVLDARTGTLIKQVKTPDPRSLINDVALVGDSAYFTDTFAPMLWRLSVHNGRVGALEPWLDLGATPIRYDTGPNLNGIAVTPDGRTLIVGQMNKGLLFRIDVATKAVAPIDTGGADLTGVDGVVLDESRLFVVRQTAVELVTLEISADMGKATVISRLKESLAWPATAVRVAEDLVVVNSQFNVRDAKQQTRPFTLSRIPVSRLIAPVAP